MSFLEKHILRAALLPFKSHMMCRLTIDFLAGIAKHPDISTPLATCDNRPEQARRQDRFGEVVSSLFWSRRCADILNANWKI